MKSSKRFTTNRDSKRTHRAKAQTIARKQARATKRALRGETR